MITALTLMAVATLTDALVSRRLGATIATAPILFATAGLLAGPVRGIVDVRARTSCSS